MPPANRQVKPHEVAAAYKELFASPAGQIVMAHLVAKFGFINKTTFVPGDPMHSAVYEGQRSVMVYIGQQLAFNPEDEPDQEAVREPQQEKVTNEGDW
jgi:hypothetical protein